MVSKFPVFGLSPKSSSNACKAGGMLWGGQVMGSKGVREKGLFGSTCVRDSPNTNYWVTCHSSSASSPSTMWCACRKECQKQPQHLTSLLNTTDPQFQILILWRLHKHEQYLRSKQCKGATASTRNIAFHTENKNLTSPRHKINNHPLAWWMCLLSPKWSVCAWML